jgi:hypothetical protein
MDGGQQNTGFRRGFGRGVFGGGVPRRGWGGKGRGSPGGGRGQNRGHGKETTKSKNKRWVRGKEAEDPESMAVEEEQTHGVLVSS